MRVKIDLASAETTAQFAIAIAQRLKSGNCVLLAGSVGAGKTHFARAAIQSLMSIVEDVPSPTFTLVQTYDTKIGEVWHADLYRLTHSDELYELGLEDAIETCVSFIEWPENLTALMPKRYLKLHFELSENSADMRHVTIEAIGGDWKEIETVIAEFTN